MSDCVNTGVLDSDHCSARPCGGKTAPRAWAAFRGDDIHLQRLSRYTTVVVNDFDISTAETEHIDEDERKILDTMKPGMVNTLSESLVKNLKEKNQFKTVVRNAKGVKNAVLVECRFSMLNGGIGGVKWLLFFMAPKNAKTYTTVVGRLVDADTGQELALFEETNTTSLHFKNFEEGFPEEADHIGEDIAEFVSLLY